MINTITNRTLHKNVFISDHKFQTIIKGSHDRSLMQELKQRAWKNAAILCFLGQELTYLSYITLAYLTELILTKDDWVLYIKKAS